MLITDTDRGFNPSDQPLDPGRPKSHWTALQCFSKRLPRIRDELERSGRAVCIPTYKRRWYTDGKLSVTERVLFPGYILFRTDSSWGDVGSIEGVVRVLANDGRAGVVREEEFARLFLDHATGRHDELQAAPAEPERRTRRRRRRPRPGRRWRARQRGLAMGGSGPSGITHGRPVSGPANGIVGST